jgi:hypothetical protein
VLGVYAFRTSAGASSGQRRVVRVNREIGRRSDVGAICPNDATLIRLAGMLLIEQSDEWLVARRYLSQGSLRAILDRDEPAPTKEIKEVPALSAA